MTIYSNKPADPARVAYLRLLASEHDAAAQQIQVYRDFYDGDQGAQLTTRLAEFLNVATNTDFAVNLVALVVDTLVERLEVRGFATGNADLDEALNEWWQANHMDSNQALVHTAAARDGAGYVIVEWDNERGRPVFYVNEAWDGDEGVKAHWAGRSGSSQMLFASKRWRETFDENGNLVTRRRLNLYFPDRIERYVTSGDAASEAGWAPYGDEPVTAWTHPRTGKPLGIPVVAFLNKRTGVSEIANAIGPQQALNKAVLDVLAAADTEGFGIYTKTGGVFVETPYVAPGAFWQDTDPAAAFGKIPPGSITALLETYWLFCRTVAIVTRRPLSLFVGYASGESGESLKERESGLVSQAKAATVYFGNAWEEVAHQALVLADAFGQETAGDVEALTISAVWADVEVRNEIAIREMLRADFQAGLIDQEYAWQEAGISEEDQGAMLRRRARREADALRKQAMQQETTSEEEDEEGDDDKAPPTEPARRNEPGQSATQ